MDSIICIYFCIYPEIFQLWTVQNDGSIVHKEGRDSQLLEATKGKQSSFEINAALPPFGCRYFGVERAYSMKWEDIAILYT